MGGVIVMLDHLKNVFMPCSNPGMDNQALIWDVTNMPIEEPQLAYSADGQINSVHWSSSWTDWIGISFDNYVEMLRV